MDGILNVNKPAGVTSFRVVSTVKRLCGERRVGHAGTLDPDATGVLPVCLGRATRIVGFLMKASKAYRAGITLGISTDTDDASGRVTGTGDISAVNRQDVENALAAFRGTIKQIPPMYSAVKRHGQPLYKLAREGLNVPRKARTVEVHRLELIGWQPPVVALDVECGKGTYIRSLARDLGQALGCGAHVSGLIRTRYGIFDIKDAVTLLHLEESFLHGYWQRFVYPPDSVLLDHAAVVLDERGEEAMKNGKTVNIESNTGPDIGYNEKQHCRAYSRDGRFLGMLRRLPQEGAWQPDLVFV